MVGLVSIAIPHYFSWQITPPDRFGNSNLFNAGSSTAYNVRIESENSTRIEPRTFHQSQVNSSGVSERFKAIRAGGAKYPSIRIIWQDREKKPYSVILELKL